MNNENLKKVFGYCRVSTENQKEEKTIEIQEEALKKHAEANGLELLSIFKDEGISGSLEQRPGLTQLLSLLTNSPEIDGVLIYKLDRLARDVVIQENLIKEFQRLGKRVLSTLEPDLDSNDPTRKLVRQILGVISEYERAIITMRLSGGRISKASKGGYAGGGVPYGYNADPIKHSLVQHDAEAKVVREIKYLKRYKRLSFDKIASILNEKGVPTKRGKRWYGYTVCYIFNNATYNGYIHYGTVKQARGLHQSISL